MGANSTSSGAPLMVLPSGQCCRRPGATGWFKFGVVLVVIWSFHL